MDYLNRSDRKRILDEILNSEENKRRKEESLIAFEIYKGRQSQFILDRIKQELGEEAALKSRTITSINLTSKIVKEQAGLYKNVPHRTFTNLNDSQQLHAIRLYNEAKADIKLKKANEIYKLADQAQLQIVLRDGRLEFRALYPHHFDVIPSMQDPEKAECYIISSFDKSRLFQNSFKYSGPNNATSSKKSYYSDMTNQKTGDPDDYRGPNMFFWWTKEFNFITNANGDFLDKEGNILKSLSDADLANPIGQLPFVDIAAEKDYEFYVRSGYNTTQLTLDLGLLFSDVSEIARLQGFSQGVISSVEEPRDMVVGPRRLMWLKKLPNAEPGSQPQFEFVSPSPDLGNSLQLISNYLSMALTSQGLSPKLVNVGGEKEVYSSGIDRFLASIEKFESSQEDISIFSNAEKQLWEIIKAWNNTYYNVTEGGFDSELSGVYLPDDSELFVKYNRPSMTLSETDKLSVIEKKLDLGLISQAEAISIDREVDIDKAKEIADEISNIYDQDDIDGDSGEEKEEKED